MLEPRNSSSDADFSFLFINPNLLLVTIHRYLEESTSTATTLAANLVEVVVSEEDLDEDSISLQKYEGVSQISNIKLIVEGLSMDDLSIVINKFSSNLSTSTKFPLIELNASNNKKMSITFKQIPLVDMH